jgi:hypothetical protein
MGFRFRKRVRLLPGLYVNLSKSGASVSVGGRGFTENISRRGVRTTLSIPGTGLSYTTRTRKWGRRPQPLTEEERRENAAAFAAIGKTIAVLALLFALFVILMAAANAQSPDPLASALGRLRAAEQSSQPDQAHPKGMFLCPAPISAGWFWQGLFPERIQPLLP